MRIAPFLALCLYVFAVRVVNYSGIMGLVMFENGFVGLVTSL